MRSRDCLGSRLTGAFTTGQLAIRCSVGPPTPLSCGRADEEGRIPGEQLQTTSHLEPPGPGARAGPLTLLAIVDHSPLPFLCGMFAIERRYREVGVHLLHPRRRAGLAGHVAELLRPRGVKVTLEACLDTAASAEDLFHLVSSTCARLLLGRRAEGRLGLDVSSASGDVAIHGLAAANAAWGDAFELTAFRPDAGCLTVGRPGAPPSTVSAIPIDIGAGPGAVGPADLLALFGFRRTRQQPYGSDLMASGAARATLDAAACALLGVFAANPGEKGPVATFRRLLQRELSGASDRRRSSGTARRSNGWISLPRAEVPARLWKTAQLLEPSGLARLKRDELLVSEPAGGGGGAFFFAGGWLEIAAAAALRRAFPDRQVDLNLGVDWGDDATEAEMDVAFVAHNSLYLVSCKNEWIEDRLRSHLDRLRAVVAEFGEAWVRPMLFSTKELPPRLARRARDYEVGLLQGPSLLNELRAAIQSKAGAAALAARLRARAPVQPRAGRSPGPGPEATGRPR